MDKRLLRIGLVLFLGLIAWVLFRQRRTAPILHAPTNRYFEPEPAPASLIDDAVETPPYVRETDPIELAFVAGALDHNHDMAEPDPAPEPALVEAIPEQAGDSDLIGYCMHCHTKRVIVAPQIEMAKDGRRMARGHCAVCGVNIVRFVKDV